MRKKQHTGPPGSRRMPDAELESQIEHIKQLLFQCIHEKTTTRDLAYKINMSESLFYQFQHGVGIKLSTLLKILHGLDMPPEEFFGRLKQAGPDAQPPTT